MVQKGNIENLIKLWNVCIVKHTLTPTGGVEEELLNFLNDKVENLIYISHPFKEAKLPSPRSVMTGYKNGVLVKKINGPLITGPSVLVYIKDVIFTIFHVLQLDFKFDLFVGVDNLNALAGYMLKKMGRVKRLVFYTIDYSPNRFDNKIINAIYHLIDKFVCYHADCIWNLSEAMMEARQLRGVDVKRCAPVVIVPHGTRSRRIKRYEIGKIERHQIAYFGRLQKEHGAEKIIDIFHAVKKEVNDASLLIIGSGDMEVYMKERAKKLGIDGSVQFKGFVKQTSECEELLAKSAIGLAPYPAEADSYKYYSDPGKVKMYLACGLPIVMTEVPAISREVEGMRAGFAVGDDIEEMKNAVVRLLKDNSLYAEYKRNAISMGSEYDWNNIFNEALLKTLEGAACIPS